MGELSFETVEADKLRLLNEQLAQKDTLDILKWGYEQFGESLVYSCSFGAEGIVLIDLISKVKEDATIIFLDTNLHFKETYELIDKVKTKYPTLQIHFITPEITIFDQENQFGSELWRTNPDQCCQIRKLNPLAKELSKYKAWISGLRREQSPTRANVQYLNRDQRFRSLKICPLIYWTWEEVWLYIKLHKLPFNELHDRNYPSIGCEVCTLPVADDQDQREGRWASSSKTECGLHLS